MAEDRIREESDHDRVLIIEEQLRGLNNKVDAMKAIASDMSIIKDAVVKLSIIQETMQEDTKKRDMQFMEYSANAERQWKKIAKTDIRLENISYSLQRLEKDFSEHQQTFREQEKANQLYDHDLRKTRSAGKWGLVTAVVASVLGIIGSIIIALML